MKHTSLIPYIAILLLSCILLLSGCGEQKEAPAATDTPAASSQGTDTAPGADAGGTRTGADPERDAEDAGSEHIADFESKASASKTGSASEAAPSGHRLPSRADARTGGGQRKYPSDSGNPLSVSQGGSVRPESTTSQGGSSNATGTTPSSAGSLHVSGTQLCDSAGNPVQLRGISTHGLAWFPDYVNESCFADFKNSWNANVIRLAMYTAEYGGYCSGGDTAWLKDLVKCGIRYAASQDLYVIVDWHILSDGNPNTHVSEAKAFFEEISSEFSGSTHILYEICNEPNGGTSWSQIKSYALEVIPVIRSNDPDAVIIVGTPNWSQFVDQAATDPITEYDNLMYALHFYAATHKEDLRSKMTSAVSSGLPVFVTEYGICDASGNGGLDIDQANQWVSAMDQLGISYVAWNLSNKSESSAILKSSCSKTSGFTQEDLSDSGKWLYEMLTGHTGSPVSSAGNASVPAAPSDEPAAPTPPPAPENTPAPAPDPGNSGSSNADSSPQASITNDSGIQVTASIINSWENNGQPYYQYTLTLTNTTGSNCSSWTIHLPCEGSMSLSDSWNGVYSISDGQLVISSMDYNGSIPAGGSIDNIGFIVCGGKLQ